MSSSLYYYTAAVSSNLSSLTLLQSFNQFIKWFRTRPEREAIELKVWRNKKRDLKGEGLAQLGEYLGRLGLNRGFLIIFDRRSDASPIDERIAFEEVRTPDDQHVTLLRA